MSLLTSGCINNKDQVKDITEVVEINGKEGVYSSITEALKNCENGDIINVGRGTYKENILVDKSVTLKGENIENTIIDANSKYDAIYISSNSVKISGFTINNSGKNGYPSYDSGIDISASNTLIMNCMIIDNEYGIHIENGANNTFNDNLISKNKFGIYFDGYYSNPINNSQIKNNIFSNNSEKGIYLNYNYDSILKNNTIFKNDYGLHVKSSDDNIISSNLFDSNNKGLFFCCGAENNIVFKNIFLNNSEYNTKSNSINQFDYDGIGNFWDDYSYSDENSDNIGEIPYTIYHNKNINISIVDRYPLVERLK